MNWKKTKLNFLWFIMSIGIRTNGISGAAHKLYYELESKKMRSFPKETRGSYIYEVLDLEAYERYWWGKTPSRRALVEEWLGDPDASMFEVSRRHGKLAWTIQVHITALNKLGLLTRRKNLEKTKT